MLSVAGYVHVLDSPHCYKNVASKYIVQ